MEITLNIPEWLVNRILHPRDETDTRLAGAYLLGAALIELDPEEEK